MKFEIYSCTTTTSNNNNNNNNNNTHISRIKLITGNSTTTSQLITGHK